MDRKSRNKFYAVLMVATLIVAIIGATLAYFTYRTGSGDEAIKAHAMSTINIVYNDGEQVSVQAEELIPSSLDVVKKVYEKHIVNSSAPSTTNACIDDNDREVCSVYRFSIKSDLDRDVYALLQNEYNGFTYLAYALRDVTNNTWVLLDGNNYYVPLSSCSNENGESNDDCYTIKNGEKVYSTTPKATSSIFGYNNDLSLKKNTINANGKVYDLVIFINENGSSQNKDQAKHYLGTITIEATNIIDKVIDGSVN